jgi:hypothetical protein
MTDFWRGRVARERHTLKLLTTVCAEGIFRLCRSQSQWLFSLAWTQMHASWMQVFKEVLSLFLAYVVCVMYVGSVVPQLQRVLAPAWFINQSTRTWVLNPRCNHFRARLNRVKRTRKFLLACCLIKAPALRTFLNGATSIYSILSFLSCAYYSEINTAELFVCYILLYTTIV